jgi:hypothetical protein
VRRKILQYRQARQKQLVILHSLDMPLCLVSFTPVASYLAWSGDVFYQVKGGEVKTFPANIKRGLMIATAPWLLYIINSDNSSGVLAGLALVVMAIVLAFKK